jgi:hypothetical protein
LGVPASVAAQTFTYRGFVEGRGLLFPQDAANDSVNAVADGLSRQEAFLEATGWLQFAAGLDLRANSHDQVERSWQLDFSDRRTLRPALSMRRLSATLNRGPVTFDVGKQFFRWGKTDIVTPTDRFAPRDFLNVFENEFLAVRGIRLTLQAGADTIEAVWVPYFTPSRTPLVDQRWTVPPAGVVLTDGGSVIPGGSQAGFRWARTSGIFEYAGSFFDGYNHLPNVLPRSGTAPTEFMIVRTFPQLRSYGADLAVPTRWFTVKAETAYFTTSDALTDEYLLYVIQLERQTGEWTLLGGYAGEIVTEDKAGLSFAPDRGVTRSIVGRASYTVDTNRSVAVETAVRQNGDGFYAKGEFSQARGQHWRATVAGILIRGEPDDFIGQYRRNSHVTLSLRYSF